MKKRIICALLAAVVAFGLASCGRTETGSAGQDTAAPDERSRFYDSFVQPEVSLEASFEAEGPLCAASFGGVMGTRMENQMNRWMYTAYYSNSGMIEAMRQRNSAMKQNLVQWYGEFPGKYIYSMALMYALNRDENLRQVGDELVETLASVQAEDGYLGVFSDEERMLGIVRADINGTIYNNMTWDMWNQYHIIRGLLAWYEQTGNETAFQTAKKTADFIIDYFGQDHSLSEVEEADKNLSIVSAFVQLYTMTEEDRYLDFVNELLAAWQGSNGGDFFRKGLNKTAYNGLPQKRWETMHALLGMAEIYRLSGDEDYKTAFLNLFTWLRNYDRHDTGGVMCGEQAAGSPYGSGQGSVETCAAVAWLECCAAALELTGDPTICDELELTTFNAILGAQSPSGRSYVYDIADEGSRITSPMALSFQAVAGSPELNCCAVYGPCGLGMIGKWALISSESAVTLNYYGEGSMLTRTPAGKKLLIRQETLYPSDGAVRIKLSLQESEEFTLRLRIPQWSAETEVRAGGERLSAQAGSYCEITRAWKDGDEVELTLDFTPHFWAGEEIRTNQAAVYVGPLLLAYDERFNGTALLDTLEAHPLQGMKLTRVENENVPGSPEPVVLYRAEFADGSSAVLCDYATAGHAGTNFTTWLPVSDSDALTQQAPGSRWLAELRGE